MEKQLKEYERNVLLIVHVASYCNYTPQDTGLKNINQKYREKRLSILGFPCNYYGIQEPSNQLSVISNQ